MKKLISALILTTFLIPATSFAWDRSFHRGYGYRGGRPGPVYVYRGGRGGHDYSGAIIGGILGTAVILGTAAVLSERSYAPQPASSSICDLGFVDGTRRAPAASTDPVYVSCYRDGINSIR